MDDFKKAASEFGRIGGLATKAKYGSEHYRKIQKKGIETKLRKKLALKLPIDKPS